MAKPVIQVEHLGKRYRLDVREKRAASRREALLRAMGSPFDYLRRMLREPTAEETLWALRDVSFEVQKGEVLGIIGRNGAGKSTLLKIFSRITDPTEGRAILRGRVGSLLEVKAGFHPELTGRENIYLKGTILGMKKREIDRKIDEIVAFAEVEKFLDMPVKRYSSGMEVRLGFAVAAHLESEILIVDEVLAVGDAAFQRKCLGKMDVVAKEGRTVLFVSHNMSAVQALCHRAMLLESGRVVCLGDTEAVVQHYLDIQQTDTTAVLDLTWHPRRFTPPETAIFKRIRLLNERGESTARFRLGEPITFELWVDVGKQKLEEPVITIGIEKSGIPITSLSTHYMLTNSYRVNGSTIVRCTWYPNGLMPANYTISKIVIKKYPRGTWLDAIEEVLSFEVLPGDVYGTGKLPSEGVVLIPQGKWEFIPLAEN